MVTQEASSSSDIVDHIEMTASSLSQSESKVAGIILDDVAAATESTITQLATRADTSTATVTRFCRSIGLEGYPQLRRQLAAAVERRRSSGRAETKINSLERVEIEDSTTDIIRKLAAANVRAIEHTLGRIDTSELDRAVDALARARRVVVHAVGPSAPVSVDAAAKLNLVDRSAIACTDPRTALMNATRCTSDDVALAVSHTGQAREIVDFVTSMRDRGATAIVITSDGSSPVARNADVVLLCSAHEVIGKDTAGISSRMAMLMIVDALFVSLAHRDFDESVRASKDMLRAVQPYAAASRPRRR